MVNKTTDSGISAEFLRETADKFAKAFCEVPKYRTEEFEARLGEIIISNEESEDENQTD